MLDTVALGRIHIREEFGQEPFRAPVTEGTRVLFGKRSREYHGLSSIAHVRSGSEKAGVAKRCDSGRDSTLGVAGALRDLGDRGESAIHEIGENSRLGTHEIWSVLMHRELAHLRESAAQVDQIVQLHLAMLRLIWPSWRTPPDIPNSGRDHDPATALKFGGELSGGHSPQQLLCRGRDLGFGAKRQLTAHFSGAEASDQFFCLVLGKATTCLTLVQTQRMSGLAEVAVAGLAHLI
jgi:hypothetical protein